MNNTRRRSILIVEDESDWYEIIADAIHDVLSDIGRVSDYEVIYAKDYQQALDLLKNKTFTLVSMDINLTKTGGASQGLDVLKYLHTSTHETFSIIVSGESNRQYLKQGFSKYDILQYFDKAPWDEQEFKDTVKSILLYADALAHLKAGEWERGTDSCARARQVMQFQQIDVLVDRAKLRLTHPITELPTGEAVNAKLRELLRMKEPWSLLYIKVEHITEYYEKYGSFGGDTALKNIGRFIKDQTGQSDFVAYVEQGLFLVVAKDGAQPESLQSRLLDSFNIQRKLDTQLYELEDRDGKGNIKPGIPKLALTIRRVSDRDGPFTDITEIGRMSSGGASRD